MKTSNLVIAGLVAAAAWAIFGSKGSAAATTDVNGLYPIQSAFPTTASASYPITVTKAQQRQVAQQEAAPNSIAAYEQIQSPIISIQESGTQYVPSYKVVSVGSKGKKLSGGGTDSGKVIKFSTGGSMGMSSGFYKKAKSIGIVD